MMRSFEPWTCYSARIVLQHQTDLADKNLTFSNLLSDFSLSPSGILDLHKKGLIELQSIVLKGSYLVQFEKARDEETARFQAATIASSSSEQLDRYTKTIAISHPSDAFLGNDLEVYPVY